MPLEVVNTERETLPRDIAETREGPTHLSGISINSSNTSRSSYMNMTSAWPWRKESIYVKEGSNSPQHEQH